MVFQSNFRSANSSIIYLNIQRHVPRYGNGISSTGLRHRRPSYLFAASFRLWQYLTLNSSIQCGIFVCFFNIIVFMRKKTVGNINGTEFDLADISCRVPQGSIMGPSCFFIMSMI